MKCQCQVFAASARRRAGAAGADAGAAGADAGADAGAAGAVAGAAGADAGVAGADAGGDEGDVRQDRHPPAAGQQAQVTTNRNVGGARLRSVNRLVSISYLSNA
jgi:hypothetical protein